MRRSSARDGRLYRDLASNRRRRDHYDPAAQRDRFGKRQIRKLHPDDPSIDEYREDDS